MLHNLDWFTNSRSNTTLHVDTDPYEPQPLGSTLFPFWFPGPPAVQRSIRAGTAHKPATSNCPIRFRRIPPFSFCCASGTRTSGLRNWIGSRGTAAWRWSMSIQTTSGSGRESLRLAPTRRRCTAGSSNMPTSATAGSSGSRFRGKCRYALELKPRLPAAQTRCMSVIPHQVGCPGHCYAERWPIGVTMSSSRASHGTPPAAPESEQHSAGQSPAPAREKGSSSSPTVPISASRGFFVVSACQHLRKRYDLLHIHNVPIFLSSPPGSRNHRTKVVLDIHTLSRIYAAVFRPGRFARHPLA